MPHSLWVAGLHSSQKTGKRSQKTLGSVQQTGYNIGFQAAPYQEQCPRELKLDTEMSMVVTKEIEALIEKNAIAQASEQLGGFLDSFFLVTKANCSWRPVLNLKPLNIAL